MYRGATIWARKTIESEIFSDKPDKWFKIWFYLVNKANHKNNGRFKRGQYLVKYSQIQEFCGATKDQVKHCIEYLKSRHMLATQKATRGMIVTVVNYDTYQNLDNYGSHTVSQQGATQKPHRSHTINKNEKNEKNEKNKKRHTFAEYSIEFQLANYLFEKIRERKEDYKKPNLQKWAKSIDYLIRLDKKSPDKIKEVITWCQQDSGNGDNWAGWQNNILSTSKLREKFDALELRMENSPETRKEKEREQTLKIVERAYNDYFGAGRNNRNNEK